MAYNSLLYEALCQPRRNANQRSESYHVPMCEITSGLLSLEKSAKRLTQTCLSRLEMLELDEVQPGVKTLRILTSDRWSFFDWQCQQAGTDESQGRIG
jgi:hypothetical protein